MLVALQTGPVTATFAVNLVKVECAAETQCNVPAGFVSARAFIIAAKKTREFFVCSGRV